MKKLIVCVLVLGLLPVASANADTPVPVKVTFTATGTWTAQENEDTGYSTNDTTATANLNVASSFYTTLTGSGSSEELQSVQGAYTNPNAGTFNDVTNSSVSGGSPYSNSCTGTLPVSPNAPAPYLDATRYTSGIALSIQSLTLVDAKGSDYTCPQNEYSGEEPGIDVAFYLNDRSPLPDSMTTHVPIPDGTLDSHTTYTVSTVNQSIPSDCHQASDGADLTCSQTMDWKGTVTIQVLRKICEPHVTSVTGADGHTYSTSEIEATGLAPTGFEAGSTVTFRSGATVHLQDGSQIDAAAGTQMTVDPNCSGWGSGSTVVDLVLGHIWATVAKSLSNFGDHFQVTTERSALGVRGSSFTISYDPVKHRWIYHILSGTGWATPAKGKQLTIDPGQTAVIDSSGNVSLTSSWPSVDQKMVPAAQRPPKITGLKLSGGMLHFKLDRAARARVQVMRGKKDVSSVSAKAKAGANKLKPWRHTLKRGNYTLELTATASSGAAAIAQLEFRVR